MGLSWILSMLRESYEGEHAEKEENMTTITHKSARKFVGYIILLLLLFTMGRAQNVIGTIEAHHWVGWLLLLCAVSYTMWGMFWE